ncbi:unnamed protein product [Schistosoma rodhaini]|uniref:Glycosyl transferase family 1 domain-containing protein n=2 Tax=Schistosoma rodhaini TaxID=6188 RepID=A0AA85F7P8_9TREM|nr:unnamed protein product [Schistosoma rodhaini]
MYCLILSKQTFGSGNLSTALYIREIFELYLEAEFIKIVNINCESSLKDIENFNQSTANPKLVIALHLRQCSRLISLLDKSIPVLSICTGTDVYMDRTHEVYLKLMTYLVDRSFAVVLLNQPMLKQFKETWPDYPGQLQVIHQAIRVDIEDANHFKKDILTAVESKLGVRLQPFFVVVGLLRDVKDPMFALQAFLEWRNQGERENSNSKVTSTINHKSYNLLYVGSVEEDTENIQQFIDEIDGKIVHRCDSLTQKEVHSLILSSQALINCSISEGQSLAVMEAMSLGVPVVVRENLGNCDLIKDRKNGLVFRTSKELGECLTYLEENPDIRKQIIFAAEEFIGGKEFQRGYQAKLYSHIIQHIHSSV